MGSEPLSNVASDKRTESPSGGSQVGTIVALALLIGTGAGYRAMASWFEREGGAVSLGVGALDDAPLLIGAWIGRDLPLDEAIVKRTDTDAHLNRQYVKRAGRERIALFMGAGVRVRDLLPHRPEVCYTGAGWTLKKTERLDLPIADGSSLACQVHHFYRAGLDSRRVVVLNYYLVDDVYCADVSLLRSKAWRSKGKTAYVAQVQISSRFDVLSRSPEDTVKDFAVDSAQAFRDSLHAAVEAVESPDSQPQQGG